MSEPARLWNTILQRWVYPNEMQAALDAAEMVLDGYYNGDRTSAEKWLLVAHEANQNDPRP